MTPELPFDIQELILQYSDPFDVYRWRAVCREWRELIESATMNRYWFQQIPPSISADCLVPYYAHRMVLNPDLVVPIVGAPGVGHFSDLFTRHGIKYPKLHWDRRWIPEKTKLPNDARKLCSYHRRHRSAECYAAPPNTTRPRNIYESYLSNMNYLELWRDAIDDCLN